MPIDLNADLGEGFGVWRLGDDEGLLDVVSSANVACGFHAGDPITMQRVCDMAASRGVSIGAQVGYRDLVGFGRRALQIAGDELRADVLYQIGALEVFARAAGTTVRYVKPHGALYHATVADAAYAEPVADAASVVELPLLGPPASELQRAASERAVPYIVEAFADRGYQANGQLVPRTEPGALVTDPDEVVARSLQLARDSRVLAVDGSVVDVAARSLCLHGDTPDAVRLARRVRGALTAHGIAITPFA